MKRLWSYRSTGWPSRGSVLRILYWPTSSPTTPSSFKTLSRTGLETRYELFRHPWRGRGLRSQLLIQLAYATVTHRNQRYLAVYESYRRRGKRQWQAILRVAKRILRDIRRLGWRPRRPADSSLTEKKTRGLERFKASSRQYIEWRGPHLLPSCLLGLSNVWLEKSQPSPLFPICMKPLSTNLLSPVLPHFLSQPESTPSA
jgi:hypothetical protein